MPASKRAERTAGAKPGAPAADRTARRAPVPSAVAAAAYRPTTNRTDKPDLLRRLSRIEGQVRGVAQMIDADRYCIDVLIQLAAIRSALDATALSLTENHVRHCVSSMIADGDGSLATDELMQVVRRFAR
jgi:DNA-binding FrmR family transcriptional regulator